MHTIHTVIQHIFKNLDIKELKFKQIEVKEWVFLVMMLAIKH